MAKFIVTYQTAGSLPQTARVRTDRESEIVRILEGAGNCVLRIVREAGVRDVDLARVERESRAQSLAEGDWALLVTGPTADVAVNWARFYADPAKGEDWYAAEAAASKAREAATEAFWRLRWAWANARIDRS